MLELTIQYKTVGLETITYRYIQGDLIRMCEICEAMTSNALCTSCEASIAQALTELEEEDKE